MGEELRKIQSLLIRYPVNSLFRGERHGFNTNFVTLEPLNHSKRVTEFSLPQKSVPMGPKRHFYLVLSLAFTQGTKMLYYLGQIHQN